MTRSITSRGRLRVLPAGAATAAFFAMTALATAAPPLPGAIFTTTVDGDIVNENVRYDVKEDVYLDGGPGPNAPANAAGLPEGDYYFQVTDPSGQELLSTDHISCRRVHANAAGVIDVVYAGLNWEKSQGTWGQVACQHRQGVDMDHAAEGAITAQLYPYDDTPNPGGVYKVWMTPVGDYIGDPAAGCPSRGGCNVNGAGWAPGDFHGFVPAASKTDNYKVLKRGRPFTTPEISLDKFHDADLDGVWDAEEEAITGWAVDTVDPLGTENTEYTPATLLAAEAGTYGFTEATPAGSLQTVSWLDGSRVSAYPNADPTVTVDVAGDSGELHSVIFGNVGLGSIDACKVFDRNGNGVQDADEPLVPGWRFELSGTDVTGAATGPTQATADDTGCALFADLLPGTYTVTELMPEVGGWSNTGDLSATVTITSAVFGATVEGSALTVDFHNQQVLSADFGTKGYWHNRNGLAELSQADIDAVNALRPYWAPSSYFGAGDEPFDGTFTDGTLVAAVTGEAYDELAPEGSWQAEVSSFLIDPNAGADPREQLAQQLLAFIFNVQHRLDSEGALIFLPDGSLAAAGDLIADAIEAWETGTGAEQTAIKTVLDDLNNQDDLQYVPASPVGPVYALPLEGQWNRPDEDAPSSPTQALLDPSSTAGCAVVDRAAGAGWFLLLGLAAPLVRRRR